MILKRRLFTARFTSTFQNTQNIRLPIYLFIIFVSATNAASLAYLIGNSQQNPAGVAMKNKRHSICLLVHILTMSVVCRHRGCHLLDCHMVLG